MSDRVHLLGHLSYEICRAVRRLDYTQCPTATSMGIPKLRLVFSRPLPPQARGGRNGGGERLDGWSTSVPVCGRRRATRRDHARLARLGGPGGGGNNGSERKAYAYSKLSAPAARGQLRELAMRGRYRNGRETVRAAPSADAGRVWHSSHRRDLASAFIVYIRFVIPPFALRVEFGHNSKSASP